ncbi:nucleoporin [Punctularia strigosozonata HHB-11173 SS5]|uniref:nucleoporin n=1 Tax=Punctularia strigosozonata (strain HHB-11173) TaxID=741275 RepID=UPI0004418431|nr:nucleoporin [Punctularia strigosozonata HHB-11173 SS5]EIN14134.1 nucleoporin [Punctularia strigosozonata HHB-11173 SS5]
MLLSPGTPSSASYSVFPDDYRVPFQKRRLAGIPEGLFQYYNSTHVTSHMGLLPELERAWITIDHQLFLWDYVEGETIMTYNEQPDNITSVAIVKPRPGVFIDDIVYVLVICTPITVLLIGVSCTTGRLPNDRPHKEIQLYATEMSITTEVEMTCVAGMADGRIFLAGAQDGNLYELHYQEKEGWFGKRVQLINHSVGGVHSLLPKFASSASDADRIASLIPDPARGLLYALSARNVISVYKPTGPKSVEHVQTLNNLYKAAQDKAPGAPALTPKNFQIIALHVVEPNESRAGVQLVAITSTGVRLYFLPTAASSGYYSGLGSGSAGGRHLQLVHVRLPPPNLLHPDEQSAPLRTSVLGYGAGQSAAPSRPYTVSGLESSCYDAGLLVAAQKGDTDGADFLLCTSPDLTRVGSLGQIRPPGEPQRFNPSQPTYNNSYGGGPPRPPLTEYATLIVVPGNTWAMAAVPRSSNVSAPPNTPSPGVINELALQFSETTKQFMVLTNVGLTFLAKRRPMDYLRDVIEEVHAEGNVQSIIEFRDSFGRDQTCAMLLGLASGNTFLDTGELQNSGTLATVSPDLAAVAKQAFYDFGERPIWAERMTYGTGDGSGTAIFSGRREGLALYLARLVRPIWKAKLVSIGALGLRQLNVDENLLVTIQKNLFALKTFLDKNPQLFHSTPGDQSGARSAGSNEQEAWRVEQESVSSLIALLSRAVEAISFVLLLNDYRLGELVAQCAQDVQKLVDSLTFEELVTGQNGVAVSRALVNVVIDQQIGQQIGVDTISEVLQQRCGTFCSTDDVMIYKAKEDVRRAVEARNPTERHDWLAESLSLFVKGARLLDSEKLKEVVKEYQQLSYTKGAVELPLYCAKAMDPKSQGREYWHAGCPDNDPRREAWEERRRCYDLVLESLEKFEQAVTQSSATSTSEQAEAVRSHAYELAFLSDDEIFHSTLYDWLITKGLADELLEMRPAYLEAHLRREPVSVEKFQLLWQFYVKDGQPLRAAEVLAALAESTEFDLPLEARLEYLTLAVGNAKSHPISAGGRHETAIAFLTDLEEKLEVAQVQLEIYNVLSPHIHEGGEVTERITALSKKLFNISDLYQEYAEPFDLPTAKLLILHVSGHRDTNLTQTIWNQIFEEAAEDGPPDVAADRIVSKTTPLGQRFYPSESAFPLRHVASLLVRFVLRHKNAVPEGWAPRILVQCGVPYPEVWDIFHEMYESQIPPFNEQANVQIISSDIAVLLSDWLENARQPTSSTSTEIPVSRMDMAIDQYMSELEPGRTETRTLYENVKRQLRRNW